MEYFILDTDKHYIPPKPINYQHKISDGIIRNSTYRQMDKRMVFLVENHMQMVFTDIILFPCFLVSKEAMKIIKLYDPFLRFVRVIFYDCVRKVSKSYYIPFLKEVDCLTKNSKFNVDKSVIYHAEVCKGALDGKVLARISNINCKCILIRLDLAESLLRRKMIGIGLTETAIK